MGQAKRKRVRATARFQGLDDLFNDLGITSRDPGFYDDPHFMAAESDDPRFLENYAEWVNLRPRSAEYDDHVRHIVPRLAQMVFAKVEALGKHGRCWTLQIFFPAAWIVSAFGTTLLSAALMWV